MADDRHAGDWFIARDGPSHGPVRWDELLELFRAGQVSATDFVWREGLDDWVGLGTLVGPATPPPPPTVAETVNLRSSLTQPISRGSPAAAERPTVAQRRALL